MRSLPWGKGANVGGADFIESEDATGAYEGRFRGTNRSNGTAPRARHGVPTSRSESGLMISYYDESGNVLRRVGSVAEERD